MYSPSSQQTKLSNSSSFLSSNPIGHTISSSMISDIKNSIFDFKGNIIDGTYGGFLHMPVPSFFDFIYKRMVDFGRFLAAFRHLNEIANDFYQIKKDVTLHIFLLLISKFYSTGSINNATNFSSFI